MPLENARRHVLDLCPVADVADLPFPPELGGDRLEALLAPREEHAAPSAARELACCRLAYPRRGAGHDGHSSLRHRRASLTRIAACPPARRETASKASRRSCWASPT